MSIMKYLLGAFVSFAIVAAVVLGVLVWRTSNTMSVTFEGGPSDYFVRIEGVPPNDPNLFDATFLAICGGAISSAALGFIGGRLVRVGGLMPQRCAPLGLLTSVLVSMTWSWWASSRFPAVSWLQPTQSEVVAVLLPLLLTANLPVVYLSAWVGWRFGVPRQGTRVAGVSSTRKPVARI